MSCCLDFKEGQIWVCETCGLEIKVVKKCDCAETSNTKVCEPNLCLTCCDKPLKLKSL
jgi:hypothetical protein